MDECTANRYRISYARILVEIDITQVINEITIRDKDGQKMKQMLEYDWKPPYCTKCQKLGHTCAGTQQKQLTQKWIPKDKSTHKEMQMTEASITKNQKDSTLDQPVHTSPNSIQQKEHQGVENCAIYTEVRKKTRDYNKGNSSGKKTNITPTKVKHGNGFETLSSSSSLVFLDDVP